MMEKKKQRKMVLMLVLLFTFQFLSCIDTVLKIRTKIKSI